MRTPIAPDQVLLRLQKRSQRGALPGFRDLGGGAFEVTAFGKHLDHTLLGATARHETRTSVAFSGRAPRRTLAIIWIVFALTLWPGVWLTHSMLLTWFSWYRLELWGTSAWYVPLTLLAIPPLLKAQRQSAAASWTHAHETIARIAEVCEGEVLPR